MKSWPLLWICVWIVAVLLVSGNDNSALESKNSRRISKRGILSEGKDEEKGDDYSSGLTVEREIAVVVGDVKAERGESSSGRSSFIIKDNKNNDANRDKNENENIKESNIIIESYQNNDILIDEDDGGSSTDATLKRSSFEDHVTGARLVRKKRAECAWWAFGCTEDDDDEKETSTTSAPETEEPPGTPQPTDATEDKTSAGSPEETTGEPTESAQSSATPVTGSRNETKGEGEEGAPTKEVPPATVSPGGDTEEQQTGDSRGSTAGANQTDIFTDDIDVEIMEGSGDPLLPSTNATKDKVTPTSTTQPPKTVDPNSLRPSSGDMNTTQSTPADKVVDLATGDGTDTGQTKRPVTPDGSQNTTSVKTDVVIPTGERREDQQGGRGSLDERLGISRSRPKYETIDFSTQSVYYMTSYFHNSDTCMVNLHSNDSRAECPYYSYYAQEFDKWAKEYSDALRYGCGSRGFEKAERCCHGPSPEIRDVIDQMVQMSRRLTNSLKKQCNKCPVDCQWNEWSDWTQCPGATCEGLPPAYRYRNRRANREQYGGRRCQGRREQREVCPVTSRVVGQWHSWQPWTPCSGSCGGTQMRTRTCTDPTLCFTPCHGDSVETRSCGDPARCCKPPSWSTWGNWEECQPDQVTGSPGLIQHRRRVCQIDPSNWGSLTCAGRPCQGDDEQMRSCEDKCSPCVPRQWTEWENWGPCSVSPSSARWDTDSRTFRTRRRRCEGNPRQPGEHLCSDPCPGSEEERDYEACCVESSWGPWGEWSACASDDGLRGLRDKDTGEPCGTGKGRSFRERTCIPGNCKQRDGCTGSSQEANFNCYIKPCCEPPVPTSWEPWDKCPVATGPGPQYQKRRRHCLPSPDKDKWHLPTCKSVSCKVDLVEHRQCRKCVTPTWERWGPWEECDFTQRSPSRIRKRMCRNPTANYPNCAHLTCIGNNTRQVPCPCETPTWEQWGSWGQCNFTQQAPSRTRMRLCRNPNTRLLNCAHMSCQGSSTEKRACVCDRACWASWGDWTSCSYIRGRRVRQRTRQCKSDRSMLDCKEAPTWWLTCPGEASQEEPCCEPQSYWTEWEDMTPCGPYATPGPVKQRRRDCLWRNDCMPEDGRQPRCQGSPFEFQPCTIQTWTPSPYRRASYTLAATREDECKGHTNGMFPSKQPGCVKYIECYRGRASKKTCDPGLLYDSVCHLCLRQSRTCAVHARNAIDNYVNFKDVAQFDQVLRYRGNYCSRMKRDADGYLRRRRRRKRAPADEAVKQT